MSGYYQLEIRRSEEYAVLDDTGLVIVAYPPLDVMGMIDTNKRVASGYTVVPRRKRVLHGEPFSIIGRQHRGLRVRQRRWYAAAAF